MMEPHEIKPMDLEPDRRMPSLGNWNYALRAHREVDRRTPLARSDSLAHCGSRLVNGWGCFGQPADRPSRAERAALSPLPQGVRRDGAIWTM